MNQLTTNDVKIALNSTGTIITENQIRHAIRDGKIKKPRKVGRQYAWTPAQVKSLAVALGVASESADLVCGRIEEPPLLKKGFGPSMTQDARDRIIDAWGTVFQPSWLPELSADCTTVEDFAVRLDAVADTFEAFTLDIEETVYTHMPNDCMHIDDLDDGYEEQNALESLAESAYDSIPDHHGDRMSDLLAYIISEQMECSGQEGCAMLFYDVRAIGQEARHVASVLRS